MTPCQMPNPKPNVPEANLQPAPDLGVQATEGSLPETGALLIYVSGRYYDLRSRFNELVGLVRARQVDNRENMK